MKCKECERLILELYSEGLNEETKEEVERHMKGCERCARLEEEMAGIRNAFPRQSIPFSIKAAFISLIVLTVIWTVPLLRELKLEESLSVAAIILMSLIFQNTVMLIFSPLLLRRLRMKRARFETYSAG
jgi:hypothetical protein